MFGEDSYTEVYVVDFVNNFYFLAGIRGELDRLDRKQRSLLSILNREKRGPWDPFKYKGMRDEIESIGEKRLKILGDIRNALSKYNAFPKGGREKIEEYTGFDPRKLEIELMQLEGEE